MYLDSQNTVSVSENVHFVDEETKPRSYKMYFLHLFCIENIFLLKIPPFFFSLWQIYWVLSPIWVGALLFVQTYFVQ